MFDSMGAVLAAELAAADPPGLEDEALVDAICGWERLASWVAAGQSAAIAELARRRRPLDRDDADRAGGDSGHPGLPAVSEFAVDEVAAALRLSRCAAGNRLLVAVELAERLPATAAALRAGELDALKVRRIVEATTVLSDEAAAAVERRVLPRAGGQTASQLRVSLSRAVLAVDPADAEIRHRRAVADRRMCLTPLEDGMAELWALLPADGAAAVRCAVDVLARPGPSSNGRGTDGRTMDNRRADALVQLAVDALDRARRRIPASGAASAVPSPRTAAPAGETTPADERAAYPAGACPAGVDEAPPSVGGSSRLRADVHVTVPVGTLLGLGGEPGELAGYGPIPASMARRLAVDGTWRRILTDPATGAVLDVGRRAYAPPAALAEHVIARDRTCRFPGCRQPARRCDLDHTVPYPQGPTSDGNLAALCRHHHRLKHRTGWRVEQPRPGVLHWTSPTGHHYRTDPPDDPVSAA